MTRQVTISAAYGRLPGKKVYNAEIRVSSAPAGEVLKQSVDFGDTQVSSGVSESGCGDGEGGCRTLVFRAEDS